MKTFMDRLQQTQDGLIIFKNRTGRPAPNWYCVSNSQRGPATDHVPQDICLSRKRNRRAFHRPTSVFASRDKFRFSKKIVRQVARGEYRFQKRLCFGQITMGSWENRKFVYKSFIYPLVGTAQSPPIGGMNGKRLSALAANEEGMKRPRERKPPVQRSEPGRGRRNRRQLSDITKPCKKTEKKTKVPREALAGFKDGKASPRNAKNVPRNMNLLRRNVISPKTRFPDGDVPQDKARREAFRRRNPSISILLRVKNGFTISK